MMKPIKRVNILLLLFCSLMICSEYSAWAQNRSASPRTKGQGPIQKLTLTRATICESYKGYMPYHSTVVISTSLRKAVCYTYFDPVPEQTVIYHKWFRSDVLSANTKLELQPPRWATASTIHLREADKGPWRVEITDKNGSIFQTLRFSITD